MLFRDYSMKATQQIKLDERNHVEKPLLRTAVTN